MWLLRGVRKARWADRDADDPAHVEEAARDVSLRADEDGLSVFEVLDEEDGRRVATWLGVQKTLVRGRSVPLDYLLIPPDVFATLGLSVVPVSDPSLGPELSERHREVKGLTPASSQRLAATLLREKRFRLDRIPRQDIDRSARDSSQADG